jgi:hypothetical protein
MFNGVRFRLIQQQQEYQLFVVGVGIQKKSTSLWKLDMFQFTRINLKRTASDDVKVLFTTIFRTI